MRTPIFIFVCLLLVIPFTTGQISVAASIMVITNADAEKPLVTLELAQLEVVPGQAGEAVFVCDDVQWLNLAGEPGIPWKVMTVLLPPDVNLGSVSAGMANIRYESVIGTWKVLPTSPMMTWKNGQQIVIWPEGKRIVDGYDVDIYERDAFCPEAAVRLLCTGQLRKYQLAQIAVPLVRYNPVSGELLKLRETDVAVTFDRMVMTTTMATSFERADKIGKARVQKLAVNFEELISTYDAIVDGDMQVMGMQSGGGDPNASYTIITTSYIESNSTKLADFVTHKQSLGFDVQVITETDFGGGTGDTASENIRAWLQANYINDNIEYVLLIGNPDPCTGDMPMKMLWPNSTSIYKSPSDYYYADLTGNWDLDGDGHFGEWNGDFGIGGVDRFWEVLVGRIPYYGSISDLDAILQKTIDYEYETNSGSTQWRKNVLLPMKPLDEYTPGYHLGEQIKNDILVAINWLYHRVYDEDYGLVPPPETTPCTYDNVTAVWNGDANNSYGRFGLVVWSTHGNASSASHVMDILHVPDLNDNYPSFTFQLSCKNSYPEVSTNLSYELLKNGGICTIGATRESWYASGKTEYEGTSYSEGMGYEYSSRVAVGWTSGQALHDLKQLLWPGGNWMNFTVFNIYGDPALNITNEKSSEKYYVDKDATGGSNDGSSWENAFTELQSALSAAEPGDEIWVAEGTYFPGDQRTNSFRLVLEVGVYGGYAGFGEADPNERNIDENLTILSGDIGTANEPYDNCYHVVVGALDAELDGFTITGGNANGEPAGTSKENGGGMYCPTGMDLLNCTFVQNNAYRFGGGIYTLQDVTLTNCVFSNNTAMYGGGLYAHDGDVTVTNCTFNENHADSSGGGMDIRHVSKLIVANCTFSENSATNTGGGIYSYESNPVVTNCTFSANFAYYGGGMTIWYGQPMVTNCEFNGNSGTGSLRGGGGMYNRFSSPTVINCIFTGNSSAENGGGVSNYNSSPTVTNCIFSGNSAQQSGGGLRACRDTLLTNCTITGNYAGNYGGGIDNRDWYGGWLTVTLTNCILWANSCYAGMDESTQIYSGRPVLNYCCVQGWTGNLGGAGNIDADPCFVDPNGDYHLKSKGWRWDSQRKIWTWDDVTSRCADAGNPGSPLGVEPLSVPRDPNNDWGKNIRINMGAFGGTAEASMPPYNWTILADLTNDGKVDSDDLAVFVNYWLEAGQGIPSDLNRSDSVDLIDFALLGRDWFEETSWHEPEI